MSEVHTLTHFTIPSPPSALRPEFFRDPTKASLRLATGPATSYYPGWHSNATNLQVLPVSFSLLFTSWPLKNRASSSRCNLPSTLDKERYWNIKSQQGLRKPEKSVCTHINSIKKKKKKPNAKNSLKQKEWNQNFERGIDDWMGWG